MLQYERDLRAWEAEEAALNEKVASLELKVQDSKKAVEEKKKKIEAAHANGTVATDVKVIPGGENHEQVEIEGADNVAYEGTPGSVSKQVPSARTSVKSGQSSVGASVGTCTRQSTARASQRSECSKKGERQCTLNTVSEQVTIAETSLTRVGLLSHSRVFKVKIRKPKLSSCIDWPLMTLLK